MEKTLTSIISAAHSLKRLVEKHHSFVNKHIGSIRAETLDTHFLIRSVESGFSYDWGNDPEIEDQIYKGGFDGLSELMKRKFPSLSGFKREIAGDISFWAILSYFDLVDPASIGSAVRECPISCTPITLSSREWGLERFVSELSQRSLGERAIRLRSAFEKVAELECHLPRYRSRFYYGILKNCYLWNET